MKFRGNKVTAFPDAGTAATHGAKLKDETNAEAK
jgi:hypothetical protein